MVLGLLLGHDLHIHGPAWIISILNCLEQILAVIFPIHAIDLRCLLVGQVFNALLGFKMELAPEPFILFIVERERVFPEEVHIAEGGRNPPVTHDHSDLMEALRQQGPEIPVIPTGKVKEFLNCYGRLPAPLLLKTTPQDLHNPVRELPPRQGRCTSRHSSLSLPSARDPPYRPLPHLYRPAPGRRTA